MSTQYSQTSTITEMLNSLKWNFTDSQNKQLYLLSFYKIIYKCVNDLPSPMTSKLLQEPKGTINLFNYSQELMLISSTFTLVSFNFEIAYLIMWPQFNQWTNYCIIYISTVLCINWYYDWIIHTYWWPGYICVLLATW